MRYIGTIESAREPQDELTDEYGVTVILNWVALADALVEVGAKRISIAMRPRGSDGRMTSTEIKQLVTQLKGIVASWPMPSPRTARLSTAS